ncbi:MAG: xanthine dehydrogenase molybdopterin binding subunit [Hyphomicrobiaceae bacterium]
MSDCDPGSDPQVIRGGVREAVPHDSSRKHATGTAVYVDDIPEPPGTLHVALGLSEHAHARVTDIDLEPVRSAPGVVAVLTAADIPGANDVSPFAGDDPMLATGEVCYHGQPIFAVVARSFREARVAARLGRIAYQELPAILTIDDALSAQSFLDGTDPPYTMSRGDPDAAIAASPHRIEGEIRIGGQEHFYLEGQAALAVPGEDDDVTVHSSTQHPTEIQHVVARVLGLADHAVTVECRRMGGGFGGKETQGNLPAALAALAARITRRPVKVRYDRDDDFRITGKRHDFLIAYRCGFDAEGRIAGIVFEQAARCGMSFDLSMAIADRAMFHADNAYYLDTARIVSRRCKTHTASNTAFRGFGGPQGMVGIERVMDHIAHHLGRDPLEIRRANYYAEKSQLQKGERLLTPYHMTVEDCVIGELTAELEKRADYADRRAAIRHWNASSPILKRGLALTPVKFGISFTLTHLNQAGALVHLYTDGSVMLNHGGTEMGQGLYVKVAQVVAEEFQIDIERVKITATSTAKVPNTSPTAASSGSDMNGMAARRAARAIKIRMARHLASERQADPDEVVFLPGRVRIGEAELPFVEAVRECYRGRVSLSATGYYATPKISWDRAAGRGRPFYYFAYGAAVTEVAIDTLTGENRILRVDILHDAGKSLNPAIDLGQIEGGFVQGAGWLTMEELVFDDKGALRTHAPSTYKIPACSDRAPVMNVQLFERGENVEDTIWRSKAVGEPPLMLGISALMALSDAVAAAGEGRIYPALDAPATPERILAAVNRVRAGSPPS